MTKPDDVKPEVSQVHTTSIDREASISRRDWLRLIGAAGIVGTGIRDAEATINRLLLEFYKSPNNGRQIATTSDGRRLLLVHSEVAGLARIHLWREQTAGADRLDGFQDVGQIVGPETRIREAGESGFGACCVWHDDRLLVAWSAAEGIVSASGRFVAKAVKWSPAETVVPGKYRLGDLLVPEPNLPASGGGRKREDTAVGPENRGPVVTYHRTHSRDEESVGVMSLVGDRPRQEIRRGRPMFAPVADCDAEGRLHLIWHDLVGQLWYATLAHIGAKPRVEMFGQGRQPAMLVTPEKVLVVYETPYGHLNWHSLDRRTKRWTPSEPLTVNNKWLTSDQIHSPALTQDRHGVVRLFFADNTRRSTFQARWLGNRWGEITNGPRIFYRPPHFDFNLLPISRLCVERRPRDESPDIGLLMSCEPPIRHVAFRTADVAKLSTAAGHRVLFLDMQEVARSSNLRLKVETAVKHQANPLMNLGPAGSFDEDRVFNAGCVLREDGKYRMWYGGLREPRPGESRQPWYDWLHCGYAESENGIDWRRVLVNQVEWKGSKRNNILPHFAHAPLLFRDDAEPDVSRRYKGFHFWTSGQHMEIARTGKYGRKYDPRDEHFLMDLLTSPDGIHWTRHEGEVRFPGKQAKPLSAIPQSVFRDVAEPDPQKRFKAYGFMSLNVRRRGTCCLTSPDALHWTAHPEMPLIDPAVRGIPPAVGGPTGQVHDTVCFPYSGYYLALYQDQRDPLHMPVELSVSRDSETFHHVCPGEAVIPVGEAGAFDSLNIMPTTPIILDDEIRMYYGGCSEPVGRDGKKRWRALPGLATLRRDGFTSLNVHDKNKPGTLQTIPFDLPRSRGLFVNVKCPRGATLRAELADAATGKPVPGFAFADSHSLQGDHVRAQVTWKLHNTLPDETVAAAVENVVLRFELQDARDDAKLYSFWFDEK